MRILFIHKHHYLRDGTTTYYFALAKLLKKHGHQVAFFSTADSRNIPSPWSRYFVYGHDLNASYAWWQKIPLLFSIIYNWEAKRKLRALIQEFKPDIAHLHNIYYHLTPSVIDELTAQRIPIVQTLQDYQLISPNYSLFVRGHIWEKSKAHKYYWCVIDRCVKDSYAKSMAGALEALVHWLRKSYAPVKVFLAPSNFLARKYKEFGFEGKIKALWNPLDVGRIQALLAKKQVKEEDYFLYHGRLSEEKGLLVLLDALALVPQAQLKIAGEGPQRQLLERKVRSLHLGKRVAFVGFQTGKNLEMLLRKAKAIVLPSVWYESYGYTVSEGMAWGKVVIASRIGGIPELIEDKKNGFLVTPGSAQELAEVMRNLDNYNPEHIKTQAIEKSTSFDIEHFYPKLMDVYQEALKD